MKSSFAQRAFRFGLRGYPKAFRERYDQEMIDVFEQGLNNARRSGGAASARYQAGVWLDLFLSIGRERFARGGWRTLGVYLAALSVGGCATYIDFHANEVQPTLLTLIAGGMALGYLQPKGAWRRAVVVAVILPGIHVVAFALNHAPTHGHPYVSRLMIFLPALISACLGTYLGVLLRWSCHRVIRWFEDGPGPGTGGMA